MLLKWVFLRRGKGLFELDFDEPPIPLKKAFEGINDSNEKLTEQQHKYWIQCKDGESFSKYHPKGSLFGQSKADRNNPSRTLTTKMDMLFHWKYKRYLNLREWTRIGTFPEDYKNLTKYLVGMSVPPYMAIGFQSKFKYSG